MINGLLLKHDDDNADGDDDGERRNGRQEKQLTFAAQQPPPLSIFADLPIFLFNVSVREKTNVYYLIFDLEYARWSVDFEFEKQQQLSLAQSAAENLLWIELLKLRKRVCLPWEDNNVDKNP